MSEWFGRWDNLGSIIKFFQNMTFMQSDVGISDRKLLKILRNKYEVFSLCLKYDQLVEHIKLKMTTFTIGKTYIKKMII